MKWSIVLDALKKNIELYQRNSLTEEVVKKQLSVAQAVKNIFPEVDSVIVTGFPWYLVSNSTNYVRVIEILRHVNEFYTKAENYLDPDSDYDLIEEYAKNGTGKTIVEYFKGREEEILPHDIFETLYDYDFFFVVDGDRSLIGPKIWEFLAQMDLFCVERDPVRLIKEYPKLVPVDANIISTKDLYSYLGSFATSKDITWVEQVETVLIDWGKPAVRKWFFGIDMVSEFTELVLSNRTMKKLAAARIKFKKNHPFESVLMDLAEYSSLFSEAHVNRKARLVLDPFIRTAVRQRYKTLFEGQCATEWFKKFYISYNEVFGEKEHMMKLLKETPSCQLDKLCSLPELPAEVDILEIVLPLAFYSLIPSVRYESVKILIRFENNTNYSLIDIFKQIYKSEHSHHIKELLRSQLEKYKADSSRTTFLSHEYLQTITSMASGVMHDLFASKYNNVVDPNDIGCLNDLLNAYEKLESYKGGYSLNTFLEDIIRVSKLDGDLPVKLRNEILGSSIVHESVKKYLSGE